MKRAILFLALVCSSALLIPSCRARPDGGLGAPRVVDCASQAVAAHAPEALGPVNVCLAGQGDVQACLLGLIQPAIGITVDVVGCLTRKEGSAASAASQANPENTVDARRAQRAREFLEKMRERGFSFEGG
jgi:hypothetical protein